MRRILISAVIIFTFSVGLSAQYREDTEKSLNLVLEFSTSQYRGDSITSSDELRYVSDISNVHVIRDLNPTRDDDLERRMLF